MATSLMSLIEQAGFKGQAAQTMYAIVMAESGGNAQSLNNNPGTGDLSYGLAQINMIGSLGPSRLKEYGLSSNNDLLDPLTNLKVAYALSGGGTDFSPWTTYTRGTYQQYMGQSNATVTNGGSGTGGGGVTAAGQPSLTADDYSTDLNNLGLAGLLKTIPELSGLVQQAVKGGWSTTKFQQAVEASQWYRTHNASARELASLQASDPKEYATRINSAANQVNNSARQLGVTLSAGIVSSLAQQLLVQGWDSQTLTMNIGKYYSPGNTSAPLAGGIATAYQQVKQMYADYGVPTSEATLRNNALRVAEGGSIDAYKTWAISQAKSLYPSLGAALDAGMTVKDAASPYIQQMSNLLEIDPTAITLNDPLIKKALQGSVTTAANGTSSATTTTLYNFEQQLRSDPRWANTQNAKDSMSSALVHVGRDFGFGGF